ncbi:MAG: DUF1579 family protein [Alphaproteobacteria bacterium]|nr:DUF1579 family protein [Alphaproteobacteria bacterium]
MEITVRKQLCRSVAGTCVVCFAVIVNPIQSWGASTGNNGERGAALIRQMIGTWNVQEWMWPGPDAKSIALPPAVAQRQPVGDDFLQEVMKTPTGSKEPFTRISYFGYNAVNQQYQYSSVDTRAPQMMNEQSTDTSDGASGPGPINLIGGTFVAPQWGSTKDGAYRYRIVVGPVQNNHQEVELYLTPLAAAPKSEFLAFKYLYTRQH